MKKNLKQTSSPASTLEKFRPLLPPSEFTLLEEELRKPLHPGVRLNLLKEKPVSIEQLTARYGWEIQPVPYCKSGWQVTSSPASIAQTIEQRFGYYYIQEAASMLPAELFDFSASTNPLILDMAASPGGKTTHLADRTRDQGLIIANDNSADRITALKLILQTWGVLNHAITQFPGEMFGLWYPEKFDYVLLDAPCSMQGLHNTASHPMRPVTPKEVSSLAQRQIRLLTSALQAVKPGGQVVYATCTLQPEENEAVLDAVLKDFPHLLHIENPINVLPQPAPALASDGTRTFHPEVTHASRLWPHRYGTSGFFAALLRKIEPFPNQSPANAPLSSLAGNGYHQVGSANFRELSIDILQSSGFDLEACLEKHHLDLWKKDETYFAFPEKFFSHGFQFPVRSLGLPLGESSSNGFLFSHDWVSRFFDLFTQQRCILPPDQAAAWVKGLDIRDDFSSSSTGPLLVMSDNQGRFLGRGKVLPDRVKNMIPRRSILQ